MNLKTGGRGDCEEVSTTGCGFIENSSEYTLVQIRDTIALWI